MRTEPKLLPFTTNNHLLDQALDSYLVHGILPGGFLTAVLINDLYLAIGRADVWNKHRLSEITETMIQNMPIGSYGSWQAVKEWKNDTDGIRTAWVDHARKMFVKKCFTGEHYEPEKGEPPF